MNASNGLETALDGLLSGLGELLAHRDNPGSLIARGSSEPSGTLGKTRRNNDSTLHLLTALLHQSALPNGLHEATIGQIRRLVSARTVDHPAELVWRGSAQVSPRLIPWLCSLRRLPGLQVWTSEDGEWVYIAQAQRMVREPGAQADPGLWRAALCGDFPVAQLAEVASSAEDGEEDDPNHVLRIPRLPEFCSLQPKNGALTPDAQGQPAMARWLDEPIAEMPSLLGLAWPLLQPLDQNLRLPVPVVGVAAHLG